MSKIASIAGTVMLMAAADAQAGERTYSCQGINLQTTEPPLCSKTFAATGECNSDDVLATLGDTKGFPGGPYATPWEPFPIIIRSVAINYLGGPTPLYVFAGNSYTPDIMAELGGGQRMTRTPITERFGFPFPGKSSGTEPHLDLHVSCTGGHSFHALYTIYYTPSPE